MTSDNVSVKLDNDYTIINDVYVTEKKKTL